MNRTPSTLASQHGLRAAAVRARETRLVSVLAGCLLVALAAQVRIPLPGTDVPMTLQGLAVLLVGLALPRGSAAAALLAYLAVGSLGLTAFAPGSAGIFGPTGGYLIGFPVAAWLIGTLKGRPGEGSYGRLLAACAAGMLVVFACGVAWRLLWLGGDLRVALATGLLPFVAKAGVEVCLAVALVSAVRRSSSGSGGSRTL